MEGSLTHAIRFAVTGEENRWLVTAVANFNQLTLRELEVARWTAASRTNVGVAQELHITAYAVQAHLRNIYYKLGLKEAGLPPPGNGIQPILDKRALLCKAYVLHSSQIS
jgi:DNA-binding NarL/FixJ family response regulator